MSYATTVEQRERELRRSHVQEAVAHLVAGDRKSATITMTCCLAAQARVAGVQA